MPGNALENGVSSPWPGGSRCVSGMEKACVGNSVARFPYVVVARPAGTLLFCYDEEIILLAALHEQVLAAQQVAFGDDLVEGR